MADKDRLSKNIKILRNFYGETQEALGIVEGVDKTTISTYEMSKRTPDHFMIERIAKHYMVTVEELKYGRFPEAVSNFKVGVEGAFKGILGYFPLLADKTSMKNESFARACERHNAFLSGASRRDFSYMKAAIGSLSDYEKAFSDEDCKKQAAANYVSLWVLLNFFIKTTHYLMSEEPAAVNNHLSVIDLTEGRPVKDTRYEKNVADLISSLEKCNGEEKVSGYVSYLKRTPGSADLGDYLYALCYICMAQDERMDVENNRFFGYQMMYSFYRIGNPYARAFFKE